MTGDLSEPRFSSFVPPFSRAARDLCFTLELMKKCFQLQFLILLSVICYIAVLCSLARALFNPFNVHPSFVIFLITASHNIHSCNASLSFFIIYIHKMLCTINRKKNVKQATRSFVFQPRRAQWKGKFFFCSDNKFSAVADFFFFLSLLKRLRGRVLWLHRKMYVCACLFVCAVSCVQTIFTSFRFHNSKEIENALSETAQKSRTKQNQIYVYL